MEKSRFDSLQKKPKAERYTKDDILDMINHSTTLHLYAMEYILLFDKNERAVNAVVKAFNVYTDVKIWGSTTMNSCTYLKFEIDYKFPERVEDAIESRFRVVSKENMLKMRKKEESIAAEIEDDLLGAER